MTPQKLNLAQDVLPNLTSLVSPDTDQVILSNVATVFQHLSECLVSSPAMLAQLDKDGFAARALALACQRPSAVDANVVGSLLASVAVLVKIAPGIAVKLLEDDAAHRLTALLQYTRQTQADDEVANVDTDVSLLDHSVVDHAAADAQAGGSGVTMGADFNMNRKQLVDVVVIFSCLLPTATEASVFASYCQQFVGVESSATWQWSDRDGWRNYSAGDSKRMESAFQGGQRTCNLTIGGRAFMMRFEEQIQYGKRQEETGETRGDWT
jgi:hypothetical protein